MADAVADRLALAERGRKLEYFTVAWNLAEGSVAIWAAVAAGSIALLAFGTDSIIELVSACTLLWRMSVDADTPRRELNERRALRVVGACFVALAGYVAYQSVSEFLAGRAGAPSFPGIILACVAMIVMPLLARKKRGVAFALGSRAMDADAMQSNFCAYLSAVLLGGLLLNAAFGLWWADPAAALLMVPIIANEGIESLRGRRCDDCIS
jgi:divalent metal cation (Fe/Co/Zn/Cd) transporter